MIPTALTSTLLLLLPFLAAASDEKKKTEMVRVPAESREIEGWTVEIDKRLLNGKHKALGDRALKMLQLQLGDIALMMPERQLAAMRKVVIRIDYDHGSLRSAQYHPSPQWLTNNGFDPALARKVHISYAPRFASKDHHATQPRVVLHELAHAYHHQVLRHTYKPLKDAFNTAVESGNYKSVLHVKGHRTRHYALSNQMEYFAEGTEAYFGANDFYPYVRSELKEHDPLLFDLLVEIWGPLK
ncbi:MAG: metallopeptidase [Verrucomicrobiota bacterium]